MANKAPVRFDRPFTMRGDDEFFDAVSELQRTDPGPEIPTKSDVIRKAVLEARDRRRKDRRK